MKRKLLAITAAALLALSLCACRSNKTPANDTNTNTNSSANMEDNISINDNNSTTVRKEDCNSVYAKVVSVNGDHLTVNAGNRTMAVTVNSDTLLDWTTDDEVILYYTGEFGDNMQVHYIDKWTENSEVQRPENDQQTSQTEGVVE